MFDAFYSTSAAARGWDCPRREKIVEAHGGQIQVQSEIGRGTQFTIRLPIPPGLGAE